MNLDIQKTVFRDMPTLDQEAALRVFQQMDKLIQQSATRLLSSKFFVQSVFDIASEVGASLTHGRSVFLRKKKDDKIIVEKPNTKNIVTKKSLLVIEQNLVPEKLYLLNGLPDFETVAFLKQSCNLFHALATNQLNSKALFDMKLSRATYEALIDNFLKFSKPYIKKSFELVDLKNKLSECLDSDELATLTQSILKIEKHMEVVESVLGLDRFSAFSLIRQNPDIRIICF